MKIPEVLIERFVQPSRARHTGGLLLEGRKWLIIVTPAEVG